MQYFCEIDILVVSDFIEERNQITNLENNKRPVFVMKLDNKIRG